MVSFAAPPMPPPPTPTPLAKRPTVGSKRSASIMDTEDDAGLSVPAKRLRFNPEVDVHIMEDWGDKPFELVKEEVRTAIQGHLATGEFKQDSRYSKILELLGKKVYESDAPTTKTLSKYLTAINGRIAVLGECSKLVLAVLDLSWLGRDVGFFDIYNKFLVLVGSTHAKFVVPIMERLVSNFERLPAATGRLPGEEEVPREVMLHRLHQTIEAILRRIPSASSVLLRMLKHLFPNDVSTAKGYLQYQRHLLRLAYSVPELHTEVMALIMQRLVQIDVQIQRDIEELEDDSEDQLLNRPKGDEEPEDDDDSDDESISESEMTTTEEEQKLKDLRLKVAKMDGTQDILFKLYQGAFSADVRPESNEAYQELLSHFTSFIIPNRTRHSQFLLFHFSQTSPAYSQDFINRCLRMTIDQNATTTFRLTACAYVASFVARGSHVTGSQVREAFTSLSYDLDTMRQAYEPHCMGPNRRAYGTYYAITQALLYIFCFRWRDLVVKSPDDMAAEDVVAEGRHLTWFPGVKETLYTNIYSKLNPLKVCSPAIVVEFAKIANHLHFLFVFSLLECNKRIRLGQVGSFLKLGSSMDIGRRETAWDRKTGDAHHQLEAYFPFDPYHLPQSKRWIENEYNEWQLPRGMKQDEDEDEVEADEEEAENGEDEAQYEEDSDSEEEYESEEESVNGGLTVLPPVKSAGTIAVSSI